MPNSDRSLRMPNFTLSAGVPEMDCAITAPGTFPSKTRIISFILIPCPQALRCPFGAETKLHPRNRAEGFRQNPQPLRLYSVVI